MNNQIELTSTAFLNGEQIPLRYTKRGEGLSPPLGISGVNGESENSGAKSLVLIMEDPDTPIGTITHWLLWNILSNTVEIPEKFPEGTSPDSLKNACQGRNFRHIYGYLPPSPVPFTGIHHYKISIYALDTMLDISPRTSRKALLKAITGHVLQAGYLVGTDYYRKKV